jgi:TonB family protein
MKTFFPTILFFVFFVFPVFARAQAEREVKKFSCSCENQTAVREYFEQYEIQQKFIARCEAEQEAERASLNLAKPIKISGYGPGPTSLVKPYYPQKARQLRISGEVSVEVFTDENGSVIYAKILRGNAFLRESVRRAACLARFTPVIYCGKFVKTRWLIKYIFTSN